MKSTWTTANLFKLKNYLKAGAGDLSAAVKRQLDLKAQKARMAVEDAHPKVLLAALQADLAALARDAAKLKGTAEKPRVVVFIDDLQKCARRIR